VRAGKFAVEYRHGGPDRHFRCVVDTIDDVVRVFVAFASGSDHWKTLLLWEPL
jgi:hypothetical protein